MSRPLLLRTSSFLLSPTSRRVIPSVTATVARSKRMDYSSVATPERCYVDFCLVPVR